MRVRQLITTTAACSVLTLGLAGVALADGDTTINGAANNTSNTVDTSSSYHATYNDTSSVDTTNDVHQTAKTGDVNANDVAQLGTLSSGAATTTNTTTTTVAAGSPGIGGGSSGSGGGGSVASSGSVGGSGGSTPSGSSGRGGALGDLAGPSGATGLGGGAAAEGTLPDVGAKVPMDVSALRAGFGAPASNVAGGSGWASRALLGGAGLLSLTGAIVSSVYASRRQKRLGAAQ
jgi:hypothetical protein